MYAGRIVEKGATGAVLDGPLHPYTRGLLDSVPSRNVKGRPLRQIPGMTPSLLKIGAGCAYRDRCPRAAPECEVAPPTTQPVVAREVRCFRPHLQSIPGVPA